GDPCAQAPFGGGAGTIASLPLAKQRFGPRLKRDRTAGWHVAGQVLIREDAALSKGLQIPTRRASADRVQIPDRSGFPSALRGAGADRSGLPSGNRGMALGYFSH